MTKQYIFSRPQKPALFSTKQVGLKHYRDTSSKEGTWEKKKQQQNHCTLYILT